MKNAQARLFDRLAAGEQLYAYPEISLARIDSLLARKGLTLDVGCGDGTIGRALSQATVIGFDISPRCAGLSLRKGIPALVADGSASLPFRDAAFDTAFCVDVLHHLNRDWTGIVSELDRVTKPGGTLVIVEPDARNPFVRWTQQPGSPIRLAPFNNEAAIFPEEILAPLGRMGYTPQCQPIHIEGEQVVRDVFPLWQRLLKAPFTLTLAFWNRNRPNKFAIVARKPTVYS
ncbi:MAG: hypothetical protein AMXMBFR84_45390 [Candidatus Hydrogenedentota bacterium]